MELDLKRIFLVLWKHLIPLILAAAVFGAGAFLYSTFFITPTYTASAMLYVSGDSQGYQGSANSAQLTFARNLIDTYAVVLKSRPVMEQVLKAGKEAGQLTYEYSPGQLSSMISTSAVGDTEVFRLYVTCTDPSEAQKLANMVAMYGESAVREKVGAGSYSIIEEAELPYAKSSPNVFRNTVIGAAFGFFLFALIFILMDLFDVRLRDLSELSNTIGIPILGSVEDYSDLFEDKGKEEK